MNLLADHLHRKGLNASNADALVFTAPDGGAIRYANWRNRARLPACKSVGLTSVGFHDLRRLSATLLVLDKVDPKTAQSRLGHSDVRLTLGLYAQAVAEADRSAADLLGNRFFPIGMCDGSCVATTLEAPKLEAFTVPTSISRAAGTQPALRINLLGPRTLAGPTTPKLSPVNQCKVHAKVRNVSNSFATLRTVELHDRITKRRHPPIVVHIPIRWDQTTGRRSYPHEPPALPLLFGSGPGVDV